MFLALMVGDSFTSMVILCVSHTSVKWFKKHNWTLNAPTPVFFRPSPATSLPQWLCCSKIRWDQSWSNQGVCFYTQLCRNTLKHGFFPEDWTVGKN